jgi:hypothetical protein
MNLKKLEEYLKSEEYLKYIDNRFELLKKAELSYEARAFLYREFQKNIYKWIECCGWVYEPRYIQEPDILFMPFDYQAELIYKLEETFYNGDVLYIEKSRDMGITWAVVHWLVYHWLFTEKFSALIGSRKESEVDTKGSISSIFGKIRYLIYAQPKWLFPKNFKKKFHDNHMKIVNPENGSVLYGESANPNFSRGHRCVSKDTLVLTDKGFMPIKKIVDEMYPYVIDENGFKRKILRYIKVSPEKILKVKLWGNITLKGTEDHPVKVLRKNKEFWVPLKELKRGDKVKIFDVRKIPNYLLMSIIR